MSWNSILSKVMTLAKAKLNSAVNGFDDPEARLDLQLDEFEEAIILLKKGGILMDSKKIQINNYIGDTKEDMLRARNMAQEQATAGRENIARIHMGTVAYGEASISEWLAVQNKLQQDVDSISEDIIFCEQGLIAIRMRVDILKAREDVADARLEINEELTGLKNKGGSLAETLSDYEFQVEEKEAKNDAYKDMMAMGILQNVVKEAMPEPEYGRVDELMAELEREIELTTSTTLNPEEIELYATHK